jgi:beta-lactamase regulating signal transducer with metallopeptidase domain
MLEKVFLQILNMSFTSGIVILLVLVIRLLLRKAPKIYSYALWGVVLFRLVCPFSLQSVLSLLPAKAKPISQDIVYAAVPRIDTGIAVINNVINPALPAAVPHTSVNPLQIWVFAGSMIWLAGIVALLLYSLCTLVRLQRRLRSAERLRDNIYLCKGLDTALVLGILGPKIYLPADLPEAEQEYILLHEQTHIRRFDHIVRIVGFLVLCLHWFNPLVWVAFFVSGRDMEMACDEAVIGKLGYEVKKEYSASLLSLATGRRLVGGTPLAFGEGDTKSRVKNVLNFKKPRFWVAALAVVVVICAAVSLALNPTGKTAPVLIGFSAYEVEGSSDLQGSAPFGIQLGLPKGWEIRSPSAANTNGVAYFGDNFLNELHIYDGNTFIAQVGFQIFQPYEDEIPQADYYKTVYPQLRLGRFYTWDPYTPIRTTDSFESAIATVRYLPPEVIEQNPGAIAAVPETGVQGILAYDKERRVCVGIQFAENAVTREQAENIARSLVFTDAEMLSDNGGEAALPERIYFDNLSAEDEALYQRLTLECGLEEWQIHSLTNMGLNFQGILDLPEGEATAMLAPGSGFMGDRMTEREFNRLIESGILENDVYVLQSLGYNYNGVLALTPAQLDFILPNTELVDNLVAFGYDRSTVAAAGFLRLGGWETYKDLLDEVFATHFDGMDGEIARLNRGLEDSYRRLLADEAKVLLDALNQRITAYRDGSFEPMPNHHMAWPAHFPSPQTLPSTLSPSDFAVPYFPFVLLSQNSYHEGTINIWVRIDSTHWIVLEPAWFSSADSEEVSFGFGNSGFHEGSPPFDFDEQVEKLELALAQ